MRHYTPIDTAIPPEIENKYEQGVIEMTVFYTGGGDATAPLPLEYADRLAMRLHTAVLAQREFRAGVRR